MNVKNYSGLKALIVLLFLSLSISSFGDEPYNSIRIAFTDGSLLSESKVAERKSRNPPQLPPNWSIDGFLSRVKNAGYTHVVAVFKPRYENGKYLFQEAFEKTESFGLKLIPGFAMCSPHCLIWKEEGFSQCYGSDNEIKNIKMNEIPPKESNDTKTFISTPFKDPKFLEYFEIILRRIKDEFEAAKSAANNEGRPFKFNKDIEYIYLSYDEAYNVDPKVVPTPEPDFRDSAVFTLLAGYSNNNDQNYIRNRIAAHHDSSLAFKELYARNIYDNLAKIHDVFEPNPKLIICADMFDPQTHGKWKFNTYLPGVKVKLYSESGSGVLDLPGLSSYEKNLVKSNLILSPWWYVQNFYQNQPPYNADSTFRYFTEKGYKIIFLSSFHVSKGAKIPKTESISMLNEYSSKAKKTQYNVIGSSVDYWPCSRETVDENCRCGTLKAIKFWDTTIKGVYEQPVEYSIIENMAQRMGFYRYNRGIK